MCEYVAAVALFTANVYRGEFWDHVTPLVGNSAVDKDFVRDQLADQLSSACDLQGMAVYHREAEALQRKNLGSSSRRLPANVRRPDGGDSLMEKFEKYFAPRVTKVNAASAHYADQKVAELWSRKRARLKPIPLEDAVCLFQTDTNLGFPNCSTDQEDVQLHYEEAYHLSEAGFPLAAASDYPSVGTTRTQAAGLNQWAKCRALSMYCRTVANLEKQFQVPLHNVFRDMDTFCALKGQSRVDKVVSQVIESAPGEILSVDFTNFDASVPFDVLTRVFAIMRSWFVKESEQHWRFVEEAFLRSGMFLPDGSFRDGTERTGGVPSGSVFTNQVDSVANFWVFNYAAHRDGGQVLRALLMGDDGVYTFRGVSRLERLSDILLDELGMVIKMDPSKNLVSKSQVRFLQNEHHAEYRVGGVSVGVRPVMRALIGMTGHERRLPKHVWKGHYNTYRWLQQLEQCANHPRFEQLCLWLLENTGFTILDAVDAILRGDKEVEVANSILAVGDGDRGKLSVVGLKQSKVMKCLCHIMGVTS
jgi:hypothetical protein